MEVADRGNEKCDCKLAKTFPHRRKKCALGIGKSSDDTPSPQAAPVAQAIPVQQGTPLAQAVVYEGGGGGGGLGVGVAVPLQQGYPAQAQPQQAAAQDTTPSFTSRVGTAVQNGVVNGVQLGVTMGTADVVRGAINNAAATAYGAVSGKR
jgi:hypothetical protein